MKTRNGFISNSSTSSFIIKTSDYESVFDIAIKMVPVRGFDVDDKNLIKKIYEYEAKGFSKNHPIAFTTVNYDTFIIRGDKYYFVSTCNNHCFYGLSGFTGVDDYMSDYDTIKILEEAKKIGIAAKDKDDLYEFEIKHNSFYLWPEYDKIGSSVYLYTKKEFKCRWHNVIKTTEDDFWCLDCNEKIDNSVIVDQ
jgi:hypothetical protein